MFSFIRDILTGLTLLTILKCLQNTIRYMKFNNSVLPPCSTCKPENQTAQCSREILRHHCQNSSLVGFIERFKLLTIIVPLLGHVNEIFRISLHIMSFVTNSDLSRDLEFYDVSADVSGKFFHFLAVKTKLNYIHDLIARQNFDWRIVLYRLLTLRVWGYEGLPYLCLPILSIIYGSLGIWWAGWFGSRLTFWRSALTSGTHWCSEQN